jgi:hypothetical protein
MSENNINHSASTASSLIYNPVSVPSLIPLFGDHLVALSNQINFFHYCRGFTDLWGMPEMWGYDWCCNL